jgi:hypothetical protein
METNMLVMPTPQSKLQHYKLEKYSVIDETDLKKSTNNQIRLAALSGMIGPALFVVAFTLEGRLRAEYDPQSMYISALSLGPYGWTQMTNFILLGILLLVFTLALWAGFKGVKTARSGIVLLTMIASLYLLSGPFVMDPTTGTSASTTIHGTLHGIFGGIVFLLMPVCIFTFLRTFKNDPKWRSFHGWTLAFAIFQTAAVTFFTITTKPPSLQGVFGPWFGLIQRTALVPFMIWVFLFALKIYRQNR